MPHKTSRRNEDVVELSSMNLKGLQPRCEGPKLPQFPNRKAKIKFIQRLSDAGHNGHAHVFEVNIARKVYALKVFNFYDDTEVVDQLTESAVEAVGLDVVHAHTDPFYNECRAYGRLIESGLNGSVAVRAHGYTTIPAQDVHELGEEFQVAEWIQDAEEHQYNDLPSNRQLFRVIVKDLIRDDVRLTHKILNKMRRDLLRMRAQGVYPMDIKLSNYKAGLLVDLSSAMTRPHFFLDTCRESRYERLMKKDLYAFDAMIEKAKVKTWVKANTEDYKEKLRPRGRNMKYPK